MALITLTDPISGTVTDASLIASNNAALLSAINGGIDNTNISSAAAISYSKLALGNAIVNSDISAAAAIAISKLQGYPSDASKVLFGNGTWAVPGSSARLLKHTQFTSDVTIAATSAPGTSIVASGSFTPDGVNPVIVHFFCAYVSQGDSSSDDFVLQKDGVTIANPWGEQQAGANHHVPINLFWRETPTNASHAFTVFAYRSGGTGTAFVKATGAAPGFIRIYYDI